MTSANSILLISEEGGVTRILKITALTSVILWIGKIEKGKYQNSGLMLLLMLVMLILRSNNMMLETHANAAEKNRTLFISSTINSLFFIPSIFAVKVFGVYGLLMLRISGMLTRDIFLSLCLKKDGIQYAFDTAGVGKITIICIIVFFLLNYFYVPDTHFIYLLIFAILSIIMFLLLSFIAKPFTDCERNSINGLMARPVFFW